LGNTWPPDLAEFVSLVSESGANPFGLTSDRVMTEYRRWRNESYRYSGSDKYPWPQPVLYHICIEMRRTGVERQMTEGELKKLAEKLLTKWTKHVSNGLSVPPPSPACCTAASGRANSGTAADGRIQAP
jgi:hypothetical protein